MKGNGEKRVIADILGHIILGKYRSFIRILSNFLTTYLTKYTASRTLTASMSKTRKGPSMKSDAKKMLAEKYILMALMTTQTL